MSGGHTSTGGSKGAVMSECVMGDAEDYVQAIMSSQPVNLAVKEVQGSSRKRHLSMPSSSEVVPKKTRNDSDNSSPNTCHSDSTESSVWANACSKV